MITLAIIYLIGVLLAYLLIGYENDTVLLHYPLDGFFIVFSWITIILILIISPNYKIKLFKMKKPKKFLKS